MEGRVYQVYERMLPYEKQRLYANRKIGEVLLFHSDDQDKGKWTLGIIKDVFPGRILWRC